MPWLLELRADELDVLRRVEEAVRRAVQRDEALAALDVVEQRLLLLRRDLRRVGVDRSGRRSRRASSALRSSTLVGVGEVDAALRRAPAASCRKRSAGLVVAVVAEEEELQPTSSAAWWRLKGTTSDIITNKRRQAHIGELRKGAGHTPRPVERTRDRVWETGRARDGLLPLNFHNLVLTIVSEASSPEE